MHSMLFRSIHDQALMLNRMCEGREVMPAAGVVDSQPVKPLAAAPSSYDANKKLKGRGGHIVIDSDGGLFAMNLIPVNVADSTVGRWC